MPLAKLALELADPKAGRNGSALLPQAEGRRRLGVSGAMKCIMLENTFQSQTLTCAPHGQCPSRGRVVWYHDRCCDTHV